MCQSGRSPTPTPTRAMRRRLKLHQQNLPPLPCPSSARTLQVSCERGACGKLRAAAGMGGPGWAAAAAERCRSPSRFLPVLLQQRCGNAILPGAGHHPQRPVCRLRLRHRHGGRQRGDPHQGEVPAHVAGQRRCGVGFCRVRVCVRPSPLGLAAAPSSSAGCTLPSPLRMQLDCIGALVKIRLFLLAILKVLLAALWLC